MSTEAMSPADNSVANEFTVAITNHNAAVKAAQDVLAAVTHAKEVFAATSSHIALPPTAITPPVPNIKPEADEVAKAIIILNEALGKKYGPTVKAGRDKASPFIKWGWIAWVTASLLGFQTALPVGGGESFGWLNNLNPLNVIHWVWPDKAAPSTKGFSGAVPEGSDAMLSLLKKSGPGIKVLMVFDSTKKLTPNQDSAMHAQVVVDYLNTNCAVGPDGKTKEWRDYTVTANLSGESQEWRDQMAKARTSVPWIYIWK